uniref:Knr4/Smi1-like domain-containing protein n=1 Tax=Rhizochromulina marina TaxID=1034831 RepID=A0A7S2WUC1_9STRA
MTQTMSLTVAEEGNRRKGGMSRAETKQCVLDVRTWFERNSELSLHEPGLPAIEGLEKSLGFEIPLGLAMVLEQTGGEIWYFERKGISLEAIPKVSDDLGVEGCVPFATDVDGGLFVVDLNRDEAVYEWDEDGRGDEVSSSFDSFLEKLRNDLLSNTFEFVEDVGVVEGVPRGASGGK